jgi:DNA-binding XRE family transcriptional regulator
MDNIYPIGSTSLHKTPGYHAYCPFITCILTFVIINATLFANSLQIPDSYEMKRFNGNIREIRNKAGWSQEDLARQIGVSLSTVQRWEQSATKPSRLACRELERVLHKILLTEK